MLDGVRWSLHHNIAGPYCSKLLADAGADVVRWNRPTVTPCDNGD